MGYFNYFIKCVIRKFVNMLFKPKMFLAILIIIGLLFAMNITARAEWTDEDVLVMIDEINQVNLALIEQLNELEDSNEKLDNLIVNTGWISNDVVILRNTLYEVNSKMDTLTTSTANIESELNSILLQLQFVNTEISNIYSKLNENHQELIEKLDENQQQLLAELEEDNQAVLEELNMIRDSINGTSEELTTFTELDVIHNNNYDVFLKPIMIDYEPRYSYTIKVYYNNPYGYSFDTSFYYSDNLPPLKFNYNDYASSFHGIGKIPTGVSNYVLTVDVPSSNPKYVGFIWGRDIAKIEVYRSIKGIAENLNQSNDLQQQQNQLQQENNQLQQEQNDILTNDNVETDGLEFATDDTVNPTSDGFNTLFNTIYNAFCNTSSKPLNITLPYINQTFTIQPNIVSNAMQKAGLGIVVTLINSFYYYSVCLFIYKDIAKIVDNLKSGNITSDCGNVKTEVL